MSDGGVLLRKNFKPLLFLFPSKLIFKIEKHSRNILLIYLDIISCPIVAHSNKLFKKHNPAPITSKQIF